MRSLNRRVLIVVLVAVLYTLIVEPTQFSQALTATNGYGNELHGFFTSMFEFALYLFFAISCCIREIDSNTGKNKGKYYVLLLLFFFVLVLTFSRTIIACTIVYLALYAFLNVKSKASRVIAFLGVVAVIACFAVPQLNSYFFETVWKSGVSHSRERLYSSAMEYYSTLTIANKLFGLGVGVTRSYFLESAGYGSLHNGYLQIIFYYGFVGLLWVIVLAMTQIKVILECTHCNKKLAIDSFALMIVAFLSMIPSTVIVFNSSIDSFFLTTFLLVLPRYRMDYEIKNCK